MLFGKNDSPFKDNDICKRCKNKPCRFLLAGHLYPGKVTFLSRSELYLYPCYTPSWVRNKDESAGEPAALTDDLEIIQGKVEISNPVWLHKDEELKESSPDFAAEEDTIQLSANVNNFPQGASVTFDVYDISCDTPFRIATVSGKNNNGTATAEWVVQDPQKSGEDLKLAFEASAKSKYTSRADIPFLAKVNCDFVEMPDILFNHGSAIPCLDSEGILIGAITAAFIFAKNNSDREVVLFGHADTSGDPSSNYDISGWRAEGIKALCDNDSETFLDIVDLASKSEDLKIILKSLSAGYGWPTDPGEVNNKSSEMTKYALRAFQEEYNSKFKENLNVDGNINSKTWVAIFRVIRSIIEDTVKAECGEMPKLTYGYNGKGFYSCGESFPVDAAENDNYKSKENRRVEIVFFEKGKCPAMKEPGDKKKVKKREVMVYDKKLVAKKLILNEFGKNKEQIIKISLKDEEGLAFPGAYYVIFRNSEKYIDGRLNELGIAEVKIKGNTSQYKIVFPSFSDESVI